MNDPTNFPNNFPISPPLKPSHRFIGHWLVVALAIVAVVGYFMSSYHYAVWPFENLATPVPTLNPQPAIKNPTAGWQTYRNEEYGFEILIPSQWHKNPRGPGQLISADNSPYYLNFSITDISKHRYGSEIKSLFDASRFIGDKLLVGKYFCRVESCPKVIDTNQVSIGDEVGIEFTYQYKGIRVDEPRGFTNEIHRAVLKDNTVYEFWTSEVGVPVELEKSYPILNPSPNDLFKDILDTFKFISDTSTWQAYRNEEYGFEFKYPPPFEVSPINQVINKDPDVFDLHLDFPYDKLTNESRMLVFIMVDRRKPVYSWEQVKDDLKCDDGSKMVFVINGGEGVFCYQKFALDSGWFRNYQYYIHLNSNNHFYYIKTYISPEDSMLSNKVELFDQILSTFRFTK